MDTRRSLEVPSRATLSLAGSDDTGIRSLSERGSEDNQSSGEEEEDLEEDYEPRFTRQKFIEFIVFLPFNPTWKLFLVSLIFLSFAITLYKIIFLLSNTVGQSSLSVGMDVVLYVCYVAYFLDTMTAIIHLKTKSVAQLRPYKQRNIWLIILDSINLIPFDLVAEMVPLGSGTYNILKYVTFLRIYRFYVFFSEQSETVGHNPWTSLFQLFALFLFVVVHTMSCVWFYYAGETWTSAQSALVRSVQPTSPVHWYIMSFYFILAIATTAGFGDVAPTNYSEFWIVITTMIVSWVLVTGFFNGALTNVLVQAYRRHSAFWNGLRLVERDLEKYQHTIHRKLQKQVLYFYNEFWRQKSAIQSSYLLTTLPGQMIREVQVDMYWNAINQSLILRNFKISHKRQIAMYMDSECFMEGDIILKQGGLKDRMIYIVKGVIQILSKEDSESPLISFSSGTCIGESSLLLSYSSTVEINAVTYCEVQILTKRKLMQMTSANPQIGRLIYCTHKAQITRAIHDLQRRRHKEDGAISMNLFPFRALKELKMALRNRDEIESKEPPFSWMTETEMKEFLSEEDLKSLVPREKNHKEKILDQYRLSTAKKLETDDVCLETHWPWVYNPNSRLLNLWGWTTVTVVFIASIIIPIYVGYQLIGYHSYSVESALAVVDFFYWIDIYLQLTTAININDEFVTSISQITMLKLKNGIFMLDIIATIPWNSLTSSLNIVNDPSITHILRFNRLLKVHVITRKFDSLQNGSLWDNTFVRMIKYVTCILLGAFWMGTIFYIQACFKGCEGSWVDILDNKSNPQVQSFYFAVVVVSGTGFGDITPQNLQEVCLVIIFFFIGVLLYSYLISDYSGMLILKDGERQQFQERVIVISRFLEVNNLSVSVRDRVHRFLSLQWNYRRGFAIMRSGNLYSSAPKAMSETIKIMKRNKYFQSMDLLKECEPKIIDALCLCSESYVLPPNEVITYAGEINRAFYIITQGFCETSSNLWQEVNIIGPYSCVNESEMIFGIPGWYNVKTLTHCHVVRVSYEHFTKVFSTYPQSNKNFNQLRSEILKDPRLSPTKAHMQSDTVYESEDTAETNWIIHRASTGHNLNKDLDDPFINLHIFSFIRHFLLRRTLHPSGKFLMYYEAVRCILAFVSGLVFPAMGIMLPSYPTLIYFSSLLDVMAYIDIYVRMHICYYNADGILVSHPWYTARRYFVHGFALDLFACFPFERVIINSITIEGFVNPTFLRNFGRFNRCLQLHRLSSLLAYWEEDLFSQSKSMKLVKYIPYMFVQVNFLGSFYAILNCYHNENGEIIMNRATWLYGLSTDPDSIFFFRLDSSETVHLISCYWITQTMLNIGFGDIIPNNVLEMMFCVVIILLGYLVETYMTVRIASSHANYNNILTFYQQHMNHLTDFMTRENITKYLRREITEHFENVWGKTRGILPYEMFSKFHLQLREETAMHLYEETLHMNSLFKGVERSFFRRLVVLMREKYFVAGAEVISINDFVTSIYFVHQGELNIYDLNGEKDTILERGDVFGNLEKHAGIRLTTSIEASRNVNLLVISTSTFYKLVHDYPIVGARLKGNGSDEIMRLYLQRKTQNAPSSEQVTLTSVDANVNSGNTPSNLSATLCQVISYAHVLLMVLSYASCYLVCYQLAFQNHEPWVLITNYTIEFILLLRIYLGFYTPYQDKMGDLVYNGDLIKKKYMKDALGFWFDIVSSAPIDLFCFAAPAQDQLYVLSWLRTLHLLRILHVKKFYNIRFEKLNVNIMLYSLSNITLWFMLYGFISACIWFMIACPRAICPPESWAGFSPECQGSYFTCSIYFMCETFSTAGLGNISPHTISEVTFVIVTTILSRFAIALFIGNILAVVANYSLALVNYNFETYILRDYMMGNPISRPLINKVLEYVKFMWMREKGYQVPAFLKETPPYLLARFNMEAYGNHLYENYIFSACDGDFLRQLIVYLRRFTFFPGNFIVQQGDIDNSLYFVHNGEVEVIAMGENTVELVDVLTSGDTFGLRQGLNVSVPHDYTFRASAVSVLLTLRLDDWQHLIKYFPGTHNDILQRVSTVLQPHMIKHVG